MTYGNPNTDLILEVGSAGLPPDPSLVTNTPTQQTLATALDPAKEILLGLIEFTINAYLGPVWGVIKPFLTSKFSDGYVIQHKLAFDPEPYIGKAQVLKFPLLAGWRSKTTNKEFSLNLRQTETTWNLTYVIGEATIEDIGHLDGLLHGVENAIKTALDYGFYPGYLDGYNCLCDKNFGCKFQLVNYLTCEFNSWQISNGESLIVYPALMITFATQENVNTPIDIYPDLNGATINANVTDGYLGTLTVASGMTEFPPDNQ